MNVIGRRPKASALGDSDKSLQLLQIEIDA
jgi:hypothetical protein